MKDFTKNLELSMAKQALQDAGLYIVPAERIDELCEVAADAYQDYPLHTWFTNGIYDPVASKLIMKATLASMIDSAIIYADSEELNGFAVLIPPGFTGSKTLPFLQHGGIRLVLHSGLGIVRKLLTYETFAMGLKNKHIRHIDWYLYNLSVQRDAQGKGIASKLLRPLFEFCNDEVNVLYLETNKESNVAIYEHYGFELKETTTVPGSNVKHYCMIHVPQTNE